MLEELQNNGVGIINSSSQTDTSTIIVTGVPRSGTSMVAAALNALGVYMGDKADQAVFEDVRLANALEKNSESLLDIVSQYNATHDTWGFKRPTAFKYVTPYLHIFRNPRVIMTFRDPVAIAKRNEISMSSSFGDQLRDSVRASNLLVEFALSLDIPAMLVSYEKALFNPGAFVAALRDFCGLRQSDEAEDRATRAIHNGPEIYLRASQVRFDRSAL